MKKMLVWIHLKVPIVSFVCDRYDHDLCLKVISEGEVVSEIFDKSEENAAQFLLQRFHGGSVFRNLSEMRMAKSLSSSGGSLQNLLQY